MAWKWVSELKNDMSGSIKLAVPGFIPTDAEMSSTAQITRGGGRYATTEADTNPNYYVGRALIADIDAQIAAGVDNVHDYISNYDKWLYGLTPGTALNFLCEISPNGSYYRANFAPWRWLNYGSRVSLGRSSTTFQTNTALLRNNFCWAIAIDDERETACLCYVQTVLSYIVGPESPQYYDSANVNVQAFNGGVFPAGNYNIYNVIKGSIPGGGGSAGPYDDGGTSTPGTQDATWDDTSDLINVPAAPSFSLILNKLIHAWAPSVSDLDDIGTYLWSNFDLTDPTKTLSKVFQSPLESILTLHALPFAVSSGSATELTLAGFATGVQLPPLTAQFKDVPCGSITIEPYWDNYLDYNPYTQLTLCLPFAGQVTLDPDEVMGKTVSVTYRVDCLTGSFVCFVFIDGDKVLGQYAGNCALSIPISAADYGRFNAAILGVAATAASAFGAAASGGLMTPMGLADGGMTITGGTLNAGALAGAGRQIGGSLVQNVQNAKVRVAHSGGLTGAPGFMGIQKPYLIIHRARQSVPENYGGFRGYPLNVTKTLGECSGFTSVREIHLDGIPLTEPELNELRAILEGGIII